MFTYVKTLGSFLFAMTACASASASQQSGPITTLMVRSSDGVVLVRLPEPGSRTARPACATQAYWLVKNENTDAGKRIFATLLAAKMAGKQVTIVGSGACTKFGGEDIEELYPND